MSEAAVRRWQPAAFEAPDRRTVTDLESRRRKAAEEGYAAGYRDGQAAAKAIVQRHADLLAATERSIGLMEEKLAGDLVDLAMDVAREVLRSELRSNRDAVVAVATEALGLLSQEAANVKLVAHPSDAELLRARLAEELSRGRWTLAEDPRIEPGGVRVLSSAGSVDATMGTRWRRILSGLGQDHELHEPRSE